MSAESQKETTVPNTSTEKPLKKQRKTRKKGSAYALMKKQRQEKRRTEEMLKLKNDREKVSVKLIEHWVNFSLEEASANPDLYMTEESITLMSSVEKHPDFIALIQKLENNGYNVQHAFGSGPKKRPILTIIISWEHHLKEANEDIKQEPIIATNLIPEVPPEN
ncbi:MAG: hypothetical protein CMF61_04125 [Magnetococcales bacterium]|nr:hypothetical protein [Magnetococcales bacterium]|tara:strand:- start:5 stop:496 length:492 start_codon:yes stop_codon:yes gene_type:complete